ncbi:flagellar hook capping FlgD N-terminal domain-containing protein [Catenovulum maritimum]|uniref:Basal-body rod modification protein FlgD n=1 Tax=Catenovulum maritimum TaxID=1513271 RepID=A0A0J8GRY3_9ALTE|nr:flagellar hook capping FlgD N-terminal domain-containing protein [Catenovulum maritimum]KMT65487.1 hypothetical protein XM47_09045 [Catenovulum maritimum]
MVDSVSNSNSLSDLYWKKEEVNSAPEEKGALTQDDFFSLLTTQMAAQDPTNPTDNDQMISQMTNFTMAEGISDLNEKFTELSSQFGSILGSIESGQTSNKALQASSMVGRTVLVSAEEAPLFSLDEENRAMAGQVMFDGSMNDIKLQIKDQSGKLIQTLDLGASETGTAGFNWDGRNSDGELMGPNMYQISASAIDANTGMRTDLAVGAYSTVNSVRFGSGSELSMNLAGLGSYSMDDIIEVAP